MHGVRVVRQVDQPGRDGDAALGGQDQLEFQLALDDGVVHGGLTSGSPVRGAGPGSRPTPAESTDVPGYDATSRPESGIGRILLGVRKPS
ncbi:hypothetical protein GCM10017778_24530 [Streptomyces vinaceus]|nr:hypothetical protein GCM10017778_24530 [Streptomyces vinaceus]